MKNEYVVSLINKGGCQFDNCTFTNLAKAKKWAQGRGNKYKMVIIKNNDFMNPMEIWTK